MIGKIRIDGVLACPHCKSSEGFYVKVEILQKINIVFNYRGAELSRLSKSDNTIQERLISSVPVCNSCKKIIPSLIVESVK